MSKVVIAGDASGTGTFTISAPNGNTDRTLVLPDEAGTIITTAGVPASAMPSGSVLQVLYKKFSSATTLTTPNTFLPVSDGTLSIQSTVPNSKFLVRISVQGYQSSGNGFNMGLQRITGGTFTRLLGVDGSSGNAWMGGGNGLTNVSYTVAREYLDSPNLPSNTYIAYGVMAALWTSGTLHVNYSGYSGESLITIEEIAP